MGKKMKLPSLFKTTTEATTEASSSWPWPSCGNPKTLSFRAGGDVIFKTINSAYVVDSSATATDSPELDIFSGELEEESGGGFGGDSIERVIRGLRSGERLFFEPKETSSIVNGMGIKSQRDGLGLMMKEGSVVMAMESEEPHVDFKRSMEEMVEGYGLKDWESLQELLSLYLKLNAKNNYGYIVGAFVDLLLGLNFPPCYCNCNHSSSSSSSSSSFVRVVQSPTSPLSFSSSTSSVSPCLSSLEAEVQSEKSSG